MHAYCPATRLYQISLATLFLLSLVLLGQIPGGSLVPHHALLSHESHLTGHNQGGLGGPLSSFHGAPIENTYYVFRNVLLHSDNSLTYFTAPDDTSNESVEQQKQQQEQPPAQILLRPNDKPFAIKTQPVYQPHVCSRYVQKPHIVMDAAPWGNNVFHFYNDLAMPLFQTMVEQGWISGHEWDVREEPPDYPGAAAVGLIGVTQSPFIHNWAYLMPYLTTDRRSIQAAGGLCFQTLAVECSQRLNWYWLPVPNMTATKEALVLFRTWHERITTDYERRRGNWPLPEFGLGKSGDGMVRPRVTLSHRSHSRSILNEEDILTLINELYEVEVTVTEPDGNILRGHGFGNMAEGVGMHYLTWMNPYPENAMLRETDFPPHNMEVSYAFQEHPSPDWPLPAHEPVAPLWIYQHTKVDIPSFQPVLEEAFRLAGIPKRAHHGPAGSV
ncbi:hypothetical protein WJX84_010296 [Apatococcus fuscideae]|uniref:Uncharacterized protein n=1 Tax=Apatococcus fuscideae TaxID=2026836 RepID=A0AAW1SNN6_9CHLO